MTYVLCCIFCLSGVAALLFETLWFHQAGLALGHSIWASSLVLAAFMGGLALGNGLMGRVGHRLRRLVWWYGVMEVAIGVTGVALVWWLPRLTPFLTPLMQPLMEQPWILNPLRLVVAFSVLLIPATAMGATLPLLVAALVRRDPQFGRVLGRLYGWNTLGAVIGALSGELLLIQWLGIRGTAIAAASLNGVAALIAWRVARRVDRAPAHATPPTHSFSRLSTSIVSLLTATFIAGGMLLALEVVWFRLLLLLAAGTSLTFAIMLSIILAGIGLGGLLAATGLSRWPNVYQHLPTAALLSGVLCIATFLGFDVVLRAVAIRAVVQWQGIVCISLALMLPVSLVSGALFTWTGEALHRRLPTATRAAGFLTLANTTGAMLGSLVAAFCLLPGLGVEWSIRLLAGGYGLAALVLIVGGLRPVARRDAAVCAVAAITLLGALICFPSGFMQRRYMAHRLRPHILEERAQPVAIREGLTETIIYLRRDLFGEPLYYRLLTDNHSMSSTLLEGQRYMKLFVYLPVALHPRPAQALLISYGVGSTAKALTDTASLRSIDVVDTSRDILELSRIVYPDPADHPLDDPRVTVHVEDGRYFLQTTDRRFDLITGEPPPPKNAGIVNLYTREYFALIHKRLNEGGMVTYWLPGHAILEADAQAIIRAFCDVFTDCSLWEGARLNWILLGTRNAQGPVDEATMTRQWDDPVVGPELRAVGFEEPAQLGALFMADADHLRALTRDTAPLTDNYPKRLSHAHASFERTKPIFVPWMDVDTARARFAQSTFIARFWPASLRQPSLDAFEVQRAINRYSLRDLRRPVEELPVVHHLLTRTSLRTIPLWLMRSSDGEQRAAQAAAAKGVLSPDVDYQLGLGAIAARDYRRAARHFQAVAAQGGVGQTLTYYHIYALCLAGELPQAAALIRQAGLRESATQDDRQFLQFMAVTFGMSTTDVVHLTSSHPSTAVTARH